MHDHRSKIIASIRLHKGHDGKPPDASRFQEEKYICKLNGQKMLLIQLCMDRRLSLATAAGAGAGATCTTSVQSCMSFYHPLHQNKYSLCVYTCRQSMPNYLHADREKKQIKKD